jgi:EmrB/QacA subfamily drug resistance transporter
MQSRSPSFTRPVGTYKWLAMVGLGLGVFMATLDSSIVNISLPTLEEYFHTTFATIQWVVLSYALVITSLLLSAARLGDMLDKKKIYLLGLVLFVLGSFLCGTSQSVGWLIAFRALQALGGTMMQALGIAMVTQVFPPEERGRALGIMGGIVSTGIAIGPPLGGILIAAVGWQAVFLVNIPVGIITFILVTRWVPTLPPPQAGQRFDYAGAAILLVTLSAYALGMTLGQVNGFGSPLTLAFLAVGLLGLGVLLLVETRLSQPMIDLSLFRSLLFGVNLLMSFLVFVVLSTAFILPFFLELVKGYPTEQAGVMMMAMPVAMGLMAPGAGVLSDRFGSRGISLAGLVLIVVGCLAMSTLHIDTSPLGFVLRIVPLGLGLGLFQSPNNSAIMGSVPHHRLGIASGLLSLSRTLGQTSGVPLMGTIFALQVMAVTGLSASSDVTAAPAQALVIGITSTYRISAFVILASVVLAVFSFWYERRQSRAAQSAPAVESPEG